MSKTDKQVVTDCNELARKFYLMLGCQVEEATQFQSAIHPTEQLMWRMAVMAYEFIEGTDVESALDSLEEEE